MYVSCSCSCSRCVFVIERVEQEYQLKLERAQQEEKHDDDNGMVYVIMHICVIMSSEG